MAIISEKKFFSTEVLSDGSIAIPSETLEGLHIQDGDEVYLILEETSLRITKHLEPNLVSKVERAIQ